MCGLVRSETVDRKMLFFCCLWCHQCLVRCTWCCVVRCTWFCVVRCTWCSLVRCTWCCVVRCTWCSLVRCTWFCVVRCTWCCVVRCTWCCVVRVRYVIVLHDAVAWYFMERSHSVMYRANCLVWYGVAWCYGEVFYDIITWYDVACQLLGMVWCSIILWYGILVISVWALQHLANCMLWYDTVWYDTVVQCVWDAMCVLMWLLWVESESSRIWQ